MGTRVLMVTLLLSAMTGCPHTWSRGGTIDMAVRKNINESFRNRNCWLSKDAWNAMCGDDFWSKAEDERAMCPSACRPPR
jgi:hypothetical protein